MSEIAQDMLEALWFQLCQFCHSPFMQVVLARRTKLELSDALDPLTLLASLQEKDPNAYQFCLQLPDGSAFIGSTVSSQYTHTPCSGLCLAPKTQPLCFDEDGKGLCGQCFLLFMMHLWLYGMGKLARETICKEGTFSSQ
jgi:hypothetical protein